MILKNEMTITDAAKTHLLKAAGENAGLRLSIRGGKGCGGSEYDLLPIAADKIDTADDYFEIGFDKKLFVPALDLLKMFGLTMDYIEDDLGNRRLDISNPNESGRCGCGKSVTF